MKYTEDSHLGFTDIVRFSVVRRSGLNSFSVLRGCPSRWYDLGTTVFLGEEICPFKMGKSETEKPKTPVKTKKEKPLYPTKVVIRRLPPTLTEDRFKEELGEIPPYDFFYFVGSNMSFSPVPFSRAYINFKNPGDIVKFKDQFDGYLFVGERGVEHPAVVEYAPYQGVPRKRKHKDTKCGTIAKDPDYLAFLESLKEKAEPLPSIEVHLEEIEAKKLEKDGSKFPKTTTPLLEYLKMKRNSRNSSRPSPRISPEKKKRSEKDEPPKSLKKGFSQSSASSSSKITNSDSSRSDKYKDQKKTEKKGSRGKDESHGREKQEKRGGKDTKTRPESARGGRHYDDREDVPDRGSHRGSSRGSGRRDRSRQNHEDDDWPKGKSDTRKKTSEESPTAKGSGKPERVERGTSAAKEMETDIKEEKQGKVDAGKRKSSEEKGSRETSDGKRSEREHDARPTDRSKNMRNKDRPDRAIYQPRSRSGKSSEYPDKEKSKDTKPTSDKKENRRSSDAERSQPKQAHDERERRDRDRERNRDRDRERGSRRDRDRDRDYKDRSERERKGDRPYERDRGKRHDPDKGRSKETLKEAGGEKREAEKKQVVKSGDHTVAQDDANQ